jgi:DNA-binding transcriptional MocR family regulator
VQYCLVLCSERRPKCEDARARLSSRARARDSASAAATSRLQLAIATSWAPETVYKRAHQGARVRPNQRRNALLPGLNRHEGQIMTCLGCSSGLPLIAGAASVVAAV